MAVKTYKYGTQRNLQLSTHFIVGEFASKSGAKLYSNNILIDSELINVLEKLFNRLNCTKIAVNSGYRTYAHDKAVGGNGIGQHTKGKAADIMCYNENGIISSKLVCCTLEDMSVPGIAYISERSTHVDVRSGAVYRGDETKGTSSIWYYKSGCRSFYDYFGIEKADSAVYDGVDYSPVFNATYYAERYPDIKAAFGSDSGALLQHFVNYGMNEGRQAIETFNVNIYRSRYPDLQNAFGGRLKEYYLHYINYGKSEGRMAI